MAKHMFKVADKDGSHLVEGTAVNVKLNSGDVVPCFINKAVYGGVFTEVLTHKPSGLIIGNVNAVQLERALAGDKITLTTAAGMLLRRLESRLGAAALLDKLNAAPKIGN